jgi:hypothetical protein
MILPKNKILRMIDEKIQRMQEELNSLLEQKMKEDRTPHFFLLLKRLLNISHSPKFLTKEEADTFLSNIDNYEMREWRDWSDYISIKNQLESLRTLEDAIIQETENMIQLFGPEVRLLESSWNWHQRS